MNYKFNYKILLNKNQIYRIRIYYHNNKIKIYNNNYKIKIIPNKIQNYNPTIKTTPKKKK